MHTTWMAATASCERPAAHPTASHEMHASHASHAMQTTDADAHAHHRLPPADTRSPHHDAPSASCPMAMACTLNAVAAELPTIDVLTAARAAALPTFVARAPHWALVAPEPPPPRG